MQQGTPERTEAARDAVPKARAGGSGRAPVLVHVASEETRRRAAEGVADPLAATIAVAVAVAWALDRGVRLVEQLTPPRGGEAPVDPVEWDLHRRAVEARLAALVARHAEPRCPLDFRVLDRFPPDDIDAADTVLGLHRGAGTPPWHADESTRQILATRPGSILVVPERPRAPGPVRFARVVTPLDGSARAESALPTAISIARRHGAELVLLHVAAAPSLLDSGPPDAEAQALADALRAHNRRIANDYLGELHSRYAEAGVTLRTRLLDAIDVRRRLVEAARAEGADLMVLASHGTSGHGDVPAGAVADYLIEHAPLPVLMVGCGATSDERPLFETARPSGRPAGMAPIGHE